MSEALIEEFDTKEEAKAFLLGIQFAYKILHGIYKKEDYKIYFENNKWGVWID